jgi:hypothetical protein
LTAPPDALSTSEAIEEAIGFGGYALRLAQDETRPLLVRLASACTLLALLVDAKDPIEARRLAWPWLRELCRQAGV